MQHIPISELKWQTHILSANGLNTGVYLTLQPGESKTAFVRLRPELM